MRFFNLLITLRFALSRRSRVYDEIIRRCIRMLEILVVRPTCESLSSTACIVFIFNSLIASSQAEIADYFDVCLLKILLLTFF